MIINENYIRLHKPQILSLMEEIKTTFALEDIEELIQDYNSIEKLDDAFCDNVMYAYHGRKRDMGYIFYALLSLFDHPENILSPDKEKKSFCAISVWVLNLMPSAWKYGWLCNDFTSSIDPYLEVYSAEESQTVLKVLHFLDKANFFTEDLSREEINDIIVYWEKMVYHHEQLEPTKDLVKRLNQSNITWNDYLSYVKIT